MIKPIREALWTVAFAMAALAIGEAVIRFVLGGKS